MKPRTDPTFLAAGLIVLLAGATAQSAIRYVNVNATNPLPAYTNWNTAALTIQDAIDAADPGDQILVTNGIYSAGGYPVNGALTNRVAIVKALIVQSFNGPAVTEIQGAPGKFKGDTNVARCAYLTSGAVLAGFTLTNGSTLYTLGFPDGAGGGAWCESSSACLSNCVLSRNLAFDAGGGAYQGSLIFCSLTNNSSGSGGGAAQANLNCCLLVKGAVRPNAPSPTAR